MKYRLSCIISADLIGPLTELIAPYGAVTIKPVDEGIPAKRLPSVNVSASAIPRRRTDFVPSRGTGPIVILRILSEGEKTVKDVKAALKAHGSSPNGSGAILTKLKRKGYAKWLREGVWQATPRGEAVVKKLATIMHQEGVREHDATA